MNIYQLKLELNTYTTNYASSDRGIVSIRGAHFFEIASDTFTNNGDAFDELFTGNLG